MSRDRPGNSWQKICRDISWQMPICPFALVSGRLNASPRAHPRAWQRAPALGVGDSSFTLEVWSKLEGRSRGPIIPGSEGESLVEERETLDPAGPGVSLHHRTFGFHALELMCFWLSFAKMSVCGICNTL